MCLSQLSAVTATVLRCVSVSLCLLGLIAGIAAAQSSQPADDASQQPAAGPPDKAGSPEKWRPLFDGKTLDGWKSTPFGGEGEVRVEDGQIILDFGLSLTGITYVKELPKDNYELRVEAKRVDGNDFFCGLTFPVRESHCSLIVGGWGGALVGLSSIDGFDASENQTQKIMAFERDRWYVIRVRVAEDQIQVWIDDERIIAQPLKDHRIHIRPEMDPCRPLGISTWETKAAIRRVQLRSRL